MARKIALLKEWAYAGVTFAWVMAFISAYSIGEGVQIWSIPLVLLVNSCGFVRDQACKPTVEEFWCITGPNSNNPTEIQAQSGGAR